MIRPDVVGLKIGPCRLDQMMVVPLPDLSGSISQNDGVTFAFASLKCRTNNLISIK